MSPTIVLELQKNVRTLLRIWGFMVPLDQHPPYAFYHSVHPERARVHSEALLEGVKLKSLAGKPKVMRVTKTHGPIGVMPVPGYNFLYDLAQSLNDSDLEKFRLCVGSGAPFFQNPGYQDYCEDKCSARIRTKRRRNKQDQEKAVHTAARKATR